MVPVYAHVSGLGVLSATRVRGDRPDRNPDGHAHVRRSKNLIDANPSNGTDPDRRVARPEVRSLRINPARALSDLSTLEDLTALGDSEQMSPCLSLVPERGRGG